mgnify:CR=1 FL=1
MTEDDLNQVHLLREKCSHIVRAARSATLANILAPLLCIPVFNDEVNPVHLNVWLGYMLVAVSVRTWILYRLEPSSELIVDPKRDLHLMTLAVGIAGLGWGLGWPLMVPDLSMVNRMIYVYMTTAAMISSMFAYSVNNQTFYAFTLPIMLPAMSTLLWPTHIFPWPFSIGLAAVFLVVIGIAKNFSRVFEESVRLRFRNEQLYQALVQERDQSVASNVAKSRFIAVASHDLRQPLHAVNVNLELFESSRLDPRHSQLLQRIKSSISTLNSMFDGLLNMSKLDAYVTQVDSQAFLLRELSESVREIVASKAEGSELQITFEAPELLVRGDKLVLQQILLNLTLNALQYTEHGSVSIQFRVESEHLTFSVTDTGVGISSVELNHIFTEFYRIERTRGVHEGLGLGLTIVKRLSDLIGATISVTSTLGEGSCFTVKTQCPVSTDLENPMAVQSPRQPRGGGAHLPLNGQCIAIFEDDPAIEEAYRHTLSARGAHVVVLSDSLEELESQVETIDRIDCILSDYRLQRTTGDVLIEALRNNYNREIPAVIVTGDTSPGQIHRFQQLRAQVLHKPVTFQKIVNTIEALIERDTSAVDVLLGEH